MAAPGKPLEVAATVDGSRITLTWKEPTDGGTPTEYVIRRGLAADDLTDVGAVPASKTSLQEPGLGPATYHYAVIAKNADGSSEPSAVVEATIEAGVLQMNLLTFAFYGAVVVGLLVVLAWVVPFPTIPQPSDSLASISASVGAYLVRFGVVLLLAAFIPALMELLARTFQISVTLQGIKLPGPNGRTLQVAAGFGDVLLGVVGKLPDLLRTPAGYGVSLVLLGVLLLVGAAFGFDGEGAAGASPSPGASPAQESPLPGAT